MSTSLLRNTSVEAKQRVEDWIGWLTVWRALWKRTWRWPLQSHCLCSLGERERGRFDPLSVGQKKEPTAAAASLAQQLAANSVQFKGPAWRCREPQSLSRHDQRRGRRRRRKRVVRFEDLLCAPVARSAWALRALLDARCNATREPLRRAEASPSGQRVRANIASRDVKKSHLVHSSLRSHTGLGDHRAPEEQEIKREKGSFGDFWKKNSKFQTSSLQITEVKFWTFKGQNDFKSWIQKIKSVPKSNFILLNTFKTWLKTLLKYYFAEKNIVGV